MIHLVTDTTASMPPELQQQYSVHTVPLKITMGDWTVDEDKAPLEEFYARLKRVETTPTTSQPAPGEFSALFEELTRGGDEVLAIHISGELSGTVQAAASVAQAMAPDRITVVDSRSTTCGLTMMVIAAAQAIARGASREEAASLVRKMSRAYAALFVLQSLDYVAKGGRISGAARFLGAALRLQPILCINDGRVDGQGLARTRKRGLEQILSEMHKRVGDGPVYAGVTHILCPDEAAAFAEQVQQRFQCVNFFVNQSGPVLGCHTGPGFLGFAACPVDLSSIPG